MMKFNRVVKILLTTFIVVSGLTLANDSNMFKMQDAKAHIKACENRGCRAGHGCDDNMPGHKCNESGGQCVGTVECD